MNTKIYQALLVILTLLLAVPSFAESESKDDEEISVPEASSSPKETPRKKKYDKRKYLTDSHDRVDSGIFHVGIGIGGNFWIEPEVDNATSPTGNYFKDPGFQAGVYFDWDYSQMPENIPLGLRGMIGYKYILRSVHVFAFDGMVRRMFNFSEDAAFGLGFGASAAFWYRTITANSPNEEMVFLPSLVAGAGFEFTPFMAEFKWLVNQIAAESSRMGFELTFGFRF